MKSVARVSIALLLVFPIIILILAVKTWSAPTWHDVSPALLSTFVQSTLSALVSLILGFMGALGLVALKKHRYWIELLLLAPSFLPPLFVVLASLRMITPFPFGVTGIVLVHAIIYSGLLSVIISRLLESRIGAFAELALVEGAGRRLFLMKGVLPYLKKELFSILFFVFAMSVSSFSVPVIVGGRGVATLEVLIYEKAVIENNISQAVILCLFQFVLLFVLSRLSENQNYPISTPRNLDLLKQKLFHYPLLLVSFSILGINLMGLEKGIAEISKLQNYGQIIIQAIAGTVTVSVGVSCLVLLLLFTIAYGVPQKNFERFLQSFVSPSTVLIGIAFMIMGSLGGQSEASAISKIVIAFSILIICSLYRLKWSNSLGRIAEQREVAATLGASQKLIFYKIAIPQILPDALLLAGLAGFWAAGDFALSQIISGQALTLSMVASSLMSSYRLESATVVVWLSLFLGALCFLIFWRVSRVASKKLIS